MVITLNSSLSFFKEYIEYFVFIVFFFCLAFSLQYQLRSSHNFGEVSTSLLITQDAVLSSFFANFLITFAVFESNRTVKTVSFFILYTSLILQIVNTMISKYSLFKEYNVIFEIIFAK